MKSSISLYSDDSCLNNWTPSKLDCLDKKVKKFTLSKTGTLEVGAPQKTQKAQQVFRNC